MTEIIFQQYIIYSWIAKILFCDIDNLLADKREFVSLQKKLTMSLKILPYSSGDEKLIAPCKCAGSSRHVHATCLVTWFKKSVKHQCELCKSDVKIRKKNHRILLVGIKAFEFIYKP